MRYAAWLLAVFAFFGSAQAAQAPTTSATLNVNSPVCTNLAAPIRVSRQQDLTLGVNNSLSSPLVLDMPSLGLSQPILPASEQTVYLNPAGFPNDTVPFVVRTPSGNVLTTGQIALTDSNPALAQANLDNLLNYSTAYETEPEEEPVYYTPQPQPQQPVKGYW
jgi:hypothetical protein